VTSQSTRLPRARYGTIGFVFFLGLVMGMLADGLRTPAYAQIPDPAKQRHDTARELRQTNQLLSDILGVLRSQTLKVRIMETDKSQSDRVRKPIHRR